MTDATGDEHPVSLPYILYKYLNLLYKFTLSNLTPPNLPPTKSRNSLEFSYCWLNVFTENLKSIRPCIALKAVIPNIQTKNCGGANLILVVGGDATAHDVRQRYSCPKCKAKVDNTYQIVLTG